MDYYASRNDMVYIIIFRNYFEEGYCSITQKSIYFLPRQLKLLIAVHRTLPNYIVFN